MSFGFVENLQLRVNTNELENQVMTLRTVSNDLHTALRPKAIAGADDWLASVAEVPLVLVEEVHAIHTDLCSEGSIDRQHYELVPITLRLLANACL